MALQEVAQVLERKAELEALRRTGQAEEMEWASKTWQQQQKKCCRYNQKQ